MSIKDVSAEVSELRAAKALHDRIDRLSQARAAFLLKSLLLAGHVSEHVMGQGLGLAETLNND